MTTHVAKPKTKSQPRRGMNGRTSGSRIVDIIVNGSVHIPPWVADHDTFRRWACSDDFPQRGQYFYLGGTFWVDLSTETLIHNQIKCVISMVISSMVHTEALGKYIGDRMMLTHATARLSCEPDGMFVSNASIENDVVTFVDGDASLEVTGTPDMTLEVISKTSVSKDTIDLMVLYAEAGIAEYWLVDSTIDAPQLVILRLVGGKYVAARKQDGWVKSKVFGRSFRLTCRKGPKGVSTFDLETR